MLATIQAKTQSTDSPAAAPASPPAAAAVAESAAPVAPKEQVFLAEEPQTAPQAKKSPVPMMAGVMLALAAVGAGWFMFGSTPTPSSKGSESAARETKPAQTQDSGAGQRQQNAGPDKSVTTPSTQADNANAAAAKKANDAAEQKKAELAAQKLAEEKAAAKSAADKVASDKLASGKAAAEKAAADKTNAAKLATDKAAADKQAALDQLAADKAAADKRVADKAAADKAVADKAAADKLASEKAAVSAVASAGSIADRIAAASGPAELYKRAVALRNDGKASQAVALLRQASSQGHGPSSRLLAVIFTDGSGDVRANFREVERYKALAETQGER